MLSVAENDACGWALFHVMDVIVIAHPWQFELVQVHHQCSLLLALYCLWVFLRKMEAR
jgi:hypothetical protein